MIEKKQEEEKDLIKIRTMKEIVPRKFHKYTKKEKDIPIIKDRKRGSTGVCKRLAKKEIY